MQNQIPNIGQPWQGQAGINAGLVRGENGKPDYFLIVPTDAAAEIESIIWAENYDETEGASLEFDGLENTIALIKSGKPHPAAEWAAGLEIEGHNDLYLPSRRECALAYASVPELFKTDVYYWTSTQSSAGHAWFQDFENGAQFIYGKDFKRAARAVRRYYPLNNSTI